jgi:membrane protease YdiL (CAAX protease family)
MSSPIIGIPKLPNIDKAALKAIRGSLTGMVLSRTAALLSLVLLVLGFIVAFRIGVHQIPEFEQYPSWVLWGVLAVLSLAAVAGAIGEWRAMRRRKALEAIRFI